MIIAQVLVVDFAAALLVDRVLQYLLGKGTLRLPSWTCANSDCCPYQPNCKGRQDFGWRNKWSCCDKTAETDMASSSVHSTPSLVLLYLSSTICVSLLSLFRFSIWLLYNSLSFSTILYPSLHLSLPTATRTWRQQYWVECETVCQPEWKHGHTNGHSLRELQKCFWFFDSSPWFCKKWKTSLTDL